MIKLSRKYSSTKKEKVMAMIKLFWKRSNMKQPRDMPLIELYRKHIRTKQTRDMAMTELTQNEEIRNKQEILRRLNCFEKTGIQSNQGI